MRLAFELSRFITVQLFIFFRQIDVTKENLEKWADESYAGSSQCYEKFNRRASTRLTKSEREDIAQFLALQPTVTLEETAR